MPGNKKKRDVRQRRRAETELRLHEEIVKNMAEGVVVVGAGDGKILYANPRFEAMLGYGPGELNGRPVAVLNYENGTRSAQQTAAEIIAQLEAHGETLYEIQNVKKDGTPIWCSGKASTIDHSLYGTVWISVHEDITERKRMEQALQESEQKLSSVVENSLTGIYIVQDGRVVFANPKFAEIYGYAPAEVLGMDYLAFIHPDELDRIRRHHQARIAGKEAPLEYEARGRTKRGRTVWIMRRNRLISHRGRPAVLGNIVDITRQKRLAGELERSAARLRQLSALLLEAQEAERKRIAQELHDSLASDLAAIKFDLQMQKSGTCRDRGQDLQKTIILLQRAMDDLRRIMADLRPSTLEVLGLVDTIRSHCREFQDLHASMQVDCRIEVREKEIPDPLKIVIYRILQEAMNNAAQHSGADLLRISLTREEDGSVALVVEDNGRAFDVERARSGGRMGLIGMEERTHLYDGEFTLHSAPGQGTAVRAVWPAEETAP